MPDRSGPQCCDRREKYYPTVSVAMDLWRMKSTKQLQIAVVIHMADGCMCTSGDGFGLLVRFSAA